MNPYQEAYFKFMTQTRENVFYVSEYIASSDKWNTAINVLMGVASSSSIGAWVIWQRFSWLWAGIIATSQVLNAIKRYLPFRRRLSVLDPLRNHLERLCIETEKTWYRVANGELAEREIHDKTIELKAAKVAIEQKCLNGITLPEIQRFVVKAREKNKVYFSNCVIGEANV